MARPTQTFAKRQREMDRRDRARQKEERRQERREAEAEAPEDAVDEAALMARYGRLASRHEAGELDDEEFAESKLEIFTALGLDVH